MLNMLGQNAEYGYFYGYAQQYLHVRQNMHHMWAFLCSVFILSLCLIFKMSSQ